MAVWFVKVRFQKTSSLKTYVFPEASSFLLASLSYFASGIRV